MHSNPVLQEQFIVAKYAERRFVAGPSDASPGALERAVWAAVEDSDLRWGLRSHPSQDWGRMRGMRVAAHLQPASKRWPCCVGVCHAVGCAPGQGHLTS